MAESYRSMASHLKRRRRRKPDSVGPEVLLHLVALALGVGAEGEHLHAVVARLPLPHRLGRAVDDVLGPDREHVVADPEAPGARQDHVDLLGFPVAVPEPQSLAGAQAVASQTDALGAQIATGEARLADAVHPVVGREVLDL